jgi:hypothetical protein
LVAPETTIGDLDPPNLSVDELFLDMREWCCDAAPGDYRRAGVHLARAAVTPLSIGPTVHGMHVTQGSPNRWPQWFVYPM